MIAAGRTDDRQTILPDSRPVLGAIQPWRRAAFCAEAAV